MPLYIQIREDFRASISNGALKKGERLPSVTALAEERGVTATTIRRALQDLIDEGLIDSHVGRGTFVTEPGTGKQAGSSGSKAIKSTPANTHTYESAVAARRLRQSIARSLSEMMNLAHRPGVIAFTRGIGDPGSIEKGILNRLAQKALSSGEEVFWDYGDPRGLEPLRVAITKLYKEQGIEISPAQVLITSGSQQAVALIAQQAAESGTTVICETPCYTGVTNAFSAFGLPIETVIRGTDGPDLSLLSAQTGLANSLFYLCPVLHNPTGTDISAAKQKEIAVWARTNNATILADEVFRDLHVEGEPPASFLKDLGPERAIILGSLSKSFISGLRVGWIITSEERISTLTQLKKLMDLGCPPLMQGIAQAFLEDKDGYSAHRDRTRIHYRDLRDTTLAALAKYMPMGVSWTTPMGGFQLWVTLPKGFSSVELFLRSVEKGAAFLPGPLQDINNRFMNSFRLCYGSLSPEDINEGIRRLSEAIREYLAQEPGDAGMAGLGDF